MKYLLIIFVLALTFAAAILPSASFAAPSSSISNSSNGSQVSNNSNGSQLSNSSAGDLGDPNEIDTVQDVINIIARLTNWMFTFLLLGAVIAIIYAAFIYLTSGGGEEVATAHKIIMYAAIAIAVAMLSRGIVTVVEKLIKP